MAVKIKVIAMYIYFMLVKAWDRKCGSYYLRRI